MQASLIVPYGIFKALKIQLHLSGVRGHACCGRSVVVGWVGLDCAIQVDDKAVSFFESSASNAIGRSGCARGGGRCSVLIDDTG